MESLIVIHCRLLVRHVFVKLLSIDDAFSLGVGVTVRDGSFFGVDFGQIILVPPLIKIYSGYIITTIPVDTGVISIGFPGGQLRKPLQPTFLHSAFQHNFTIKNNILYAVTIRTNSYYLQTRKYPYIGLFICRKADKDHDKE